MRKYTSKPKGKAASSLEKLLKGLEGIGVRGPSITVDFRWNGKRYRETLKGMSVTEDNLWYASKKRREILDDIRHGRFDLAKHFPHSKRLNKLPGYEEKRRQHTIGTLVKHHLKVSAPGWAKSTRVNVVSKVDRHIHPYWGDRDISKVRLSDIEEWIADELSHLSNKTINDILSPLRAVFERAEADDIITKNPMRFIKNKKPDAVVPKPFKLEEVERIASTPTSRQSELNAFLFACYTGLSISEILALAWEDINLNERYISIKRACVLGEYKAPKEESRYREVALIPQAIEILEKQKAISLDLEPESHTVTKFSNRATETQLFRIVFINTEVTESKPVYRGFLDSKQYLTGFFKSHIEMSGVDYRPSNNGRHTYASWLLSRNISRDLIAEQLGHTTTAMVKKHYAVRIDGQGPNMADYIASHVLPNDK